MLKVLELLIAVVIAVFQVVVVRKRSVRGSFYFGRKWGFTITHSIAWFVRRHTPRSDELKQYVLAAPVLLAIIVVHCVRHRIVVIPMLHALGYKVRAVKGRCWLLRGTSRITVIEVFHVGQYDMSYLVETLLHELRHAYQHAHTPQVLANYVDSNDDEFAYYDHPSEVDARNYAVESPIYKYYVDKRKNQKPISGTEYHKALAKMEAASRKMEEVSKKMEEAMEQIRNME